MLPVVSQTYMYIAEIYTEILSNPDIVSKYYCLKYKICEMYIEGYVRVLNIMILKVFRLGLIIGMQKIVVCQNQTISKNI